ADAATDASVPPAADTAADAAAYPEPSDPDAHAAGPDSDSVRPGGRPVLGAERFGVAIGRRRIPERPTRRLDVRRVARARLEHRHGLWRDGVTRCPARLPPP